MFIYKYKAKKTKWQEPQGNYWVALDRQVWEREKKRVGWGAKGGLEGNNLKNDFRGGVLLIGRGTIGLNKSSKFVN